MKGIRVALRVLTVIFPLVLCVGAFGRIFQKWNKSSEKKKGAYINEVLTKNIGGLRNSHGEYSDWIEIYNGSEDAINLEGYHISDNASNLRKCVFPDYKIKANEYLLLLAYDGQEPDMEMNTGFGLNSESGIIFLSDRDYNVIDELEYADQFYNVSYGIAYNGKHSYFTVPTPGEENMFVYVVKETLQDDDYVVFDKKVEYMQ